MSEKIAQTMTTLSEENRDMKLALKLVLKYEIQSLLERLSQLGDDSLLLLSNNEGTSSHFATPNAERFMNNLGTTYNMNLKDMFHKFCSASESQAPAMTCQLNLNFPQAMQSPLGNQQQQQPLFSHLSGNGGAGYNSMKSSGSRSSQHGKQPQPLISGMKFAPYNTNNQGSGPQVRDNAKNHPQHVRERKSRNACRHFVQKGYCWQGSTCAFLHTKDPEILKNLGATVESTPTQSNTDSPEPIDTTDTCQDP